MTIAKEGLKTKKPKKYYESKEPEVFHYFNAKGDKLWGFRHRYYDALSKRREKAKQGLTSEKIAIRELLKVKTDLINGNHSKIDNSNLTVSEWMDIWFKENEKNWAVSTADRRMCIIRDQIKPLIGKYKLSTLDRSTYIREFINVLLEGYAIATVKNHHNIFRIAVNSAVDNETIDRNRFTRLVITSDDEDDDDLLENFLSPSELKKFLKYSKENLSITRYTAILILAYTGLRKGEASGLIWKDIDYKNKKLYVERTRDNYGTRSPKTKRSRRNMIISDLLIKQLKIYRKWCLETKFSVGQSLSEEDYILITSVGTPIRVNYFNVTFTQIYKRLDMKIITPHGLRHTHATILLMSEKRIPVAVIAKRLGNTSQMINNVYGHVIEEAEEESVVSFDDAIKL